MRLLARAYGFDGVVALGDEIVHPCSGKLDASRHGRRGVGELLDVGDRPLAFTGELVRSHLETANTGRVGGSRQIGQDESKARPDGGISGVPAGSLGDLSLALLPGHNGRVCVLPRTL